MRHPKLHRVDFDLAYLVLLTERGLKPLSRWERPIDENTRAAIASFDLALDTVERRTRSGQRVFETLFAKDPEPAAIYRERFNGKPLGHSAEVVRIQGRLFGYPSCCVESYICGPYRHNGLAQRDQEVLFHWACPACPQTRRLLPEYRKVHEECRALFGLGARRSRIAQGGLGSVSHLAASLALSVGVTGWAAAGADPHQSAGVDDADGDGLSSAEEILLGTDLWNRFTLSETFPDGVQVALLLRQWIDAPPPSVQVEQLLQRGIETCTICGEVVNMGIVRLTHQLRGISAELPFIALHTMEHGCLSFEGDIHAGRADLDRLKQILFPFDSNHARCLVGNDPDADGLSSDEEAVLGTDPGAADTDGDSLEDGPQMAEELVSIIHALPAHVCTGRPYRIEHRLRGSETCGFCGIEVDMGFMEIVQPIEGISVSLPFVALHTLAHGGFLYDGVHVEGRVLPALLRTILAAESATHWVPLEHDTDGDGLTDEQEPYFDLHPREADENGDGIPDGRSLAIEMAARLHAVPSGPLTDEVYRVEHLARGFYWCSVCGEEVNMGFLEVVDPRSGAAAGVPYYNLHFMEHGSFASDRDGIHESIDPRRIAEVLGSGGWVIEPPPVQAEFELLSGPNPCRMPGLIGITLRLPVAVPVVEIAIYDAHGRLLRDLYRGPTPAGAMRFGWDCCDGEGRRSPAGIYHCMVKIGEITVSRKVTLLD